MAPQAIVAPRELGILTARGVHAVKDHALLRIERRQFQHFTVLHIANARIVVKINRARGAGRNAFSLDTGATDTDLNEGFAKALPDLIKSGKKETRDITGYGGSNQYDSVLLGPTIFRVGGLNVTLKGSLCH